MAVDLFASNPQTGQTPDPNRGSNNLAVTNSDPHKRFRLVYEQIFVVTSLHLCLYL